MKNQFTSEENMKLRLEADANFFRWSGHPVLSSGILAGVDASGQCLVQACWILNTRNEPDRILIEEAGGQLTVVYLDAPEKTVMPLSYHMMREAHRNGITFAVVGNSHQTDDVADGYEEDQPLSESVHWSGLEPHAPNYSSRITAVSYWLIAKRPVIRMALLRKSLWSAACERSLFEKIDVGAGFGYCLNTYDGKSVSRLTGKAFGHYWNAHMDEGPPLLMPLDGDADAIAEQYWRCLDVDNRVAIAVKMFPKRGASKTVIINKFSKIP